MRNILKVEGAEIPKLSPKTGKLNKRYEEELQRVQQDLVNIKQRQEEAKVNISELNAELAVTGLDVATVQDDIKRRELLDRRETIRRQIEEEELYLNMDYQGYKQRVIEASSLDELKYDAGREYRVVSLAVGEYKEAVRKEAAASIKAAEEMAEKDNEYLKLLNQHQRLTGENYKRWEEPKQ